MKKYFLFLVVCGSLVSCMAAQHASKANIGTVNFKKCAETSLLGKKEQAQFDILKKQHEQTLEQKHKEVQELAAKFSDEYLDSLTPEAEKELREQFQRVSSEFSQLQGMVYQTLDQAHYQSMSKLYDRIRVAAQHVAQEKQLDIVLNDEAVFFSDESLDISKDVVRSLDADSKE